MRLVDEEMDRVAHEQFRKLETIHSEPDDLVNRHQYDRIQPPNLDDSPAEDLVPVWSDPEP